MSKRCIGGSYACKKQDLHISFYQKSCITIFQYSIFLFYIILIPRDLILIELRTLIFQLFQFLVLERFPIAICLTLNTQDSQLHRYWALNLCKFESALSQLQLHFHLFQKMIFLIAVNVNSWIPEFRPHRHCGLRL